MVRQLHAPLNIIQIGKFEAENLAKLLTEPHPFLRA